MRSTTADGVATGGWIAHPTSLIPATSSSPCTLGATESPLSPYSHMVEPVSPCAAMHTDEQWTEQDEQPFAATAPRSSLAPPSQSPPTAPASPEGVALRQQDGNEAPATTGRGSAAAMRVPGSMPAVQAILSDEEARKRDEAVAEWQRRTGVTRKRVNPIPLQAVQQHLMWRMSATAANGSSAEPAEPEDDWTTLCDVAVYPLAAAPSAAAGGATGTVAAGSKPPLSPASAYGEKITRFGCVGDNSKPHTLTAWVAATRATQWKGDPRCIPDPFRAADPRDVAAATAAAASAAAVTCKPGNPRDAGAQGTFTTACRCDSDNYSDSDSDSDDDSDSDSDSDRDCDCDYDNTRMVDNSREDPLNDGGSRNITDCSKDGDTGNTSDVEDIDGRQNSDSMRWSPGERSSCAHTTAWNPAPVTAAHAALEAGTFKPLPSTITVPVPVPVPVPALTACPTAANAGAVPRDTPTGQPERHAPPPPTVSGPAVAHSQQGVPDPMSADDPDVRFVTLPSLARAAAASRTNVRPHELKRYTVSQLKEMCHSRGLAT